MSDKAPTIKVVLYKSKTLSNGAHPIMLSVSYHGSRKYKSLGISCPEKYWDEGKEKVMKSHPQSKALNRIITAELTKANSNYLDLVNSNKQYTAKRIINLSKKSAPSSISFVQLLKDRAEHFKELESYNTATGYVTVASTVRNYLEGKDIELVSVDEEWITKYEIYLTKRYKDTSIKKYFDCLKAAFNYAVKSKMIDKSPLENYEHVKKLDLSTKKRALSIPEMTMLTRYYVDSYGVLGEKTKPVEEKTKVHYWNKKFRRRGTTKLTPVDAEQLSLAMFLCSYHFQGLALVDLAKLKWKDLEEIEIEDTEQYVKDIGRYGIDYAEKHKEIKECYEINLSRSKTGKPVKIVVERQDVDLYLNPFYPDNNFDDEEVLEQYIFPIYADIIDDTEGKKFGRMNYATYLVNVNLKRIGKQLGIPNITFYAARHSYASHLYQADVPTSLIAQNMGRRPDEIETYLKAFEQSKILEANQHTYITGQKGFKEGREERDNTPEAIEKRKPLEEWARERKEAEERFYQKHGGKEAFEAMMKEKWEELERELQEMFGDDNQAKVDYLMKKSKNNSPSNQE